MDDDYYSYAPVGLWPSVVAHYGREAVLAKSPVASAMFDLVKQLSTSCISVDITPSIRGETLYLSAGLPGEDPQSQARVSATMSTPEAVTLQLFAAGATEGTVVTYARINAFPMLNQILNQMRCPPSVPH